MLILFKKTDTEKEGAYMILEHSCQRRHVALESNDRLINRLDSRIVRREKRDTIGFLEELGRSYVCTICRWDLNSSQKVEKTSGVRSVECGRDVTRRDQYAVDLVDENRAPDCRVDNSDILTGVERISFFKKNQRFKLLNSK